MVRLVIWDAIMPIMTSPKWKICTGFALFLVMQLVCVMYLPIFFRVAPLLLGQSYTSKPSTNVLFFYPKAQWSSGSIDYFSAEYLVAIRLWITSNRRTTVHPWGRGGTSFTISCYICARYMGNLVQHDFDGKMEAAHYNMSVLFRDYNCNLHLFHVSS